MSQNVRFYFGPQAKYDELQEKNPMALYFLEDTQCLYKGDKLMATGVMATSMASGLMSSEDKIKLDELLSGGGLKNLTPIDNTIIIRDKDDGGKSIGVAVSGQTGNTLVVAEDGLFVQAQDDVSVPEYIIEKQTATEDGFAASYKLKKIVDGESSYVGDTINIGKDMVLQNATLKTAEETDVPYLGAEVGDLYIDMEFNDAAQNHIYVPVNELIDIYTAGDGIEITDGSVSVKISENAHGLTTVDGAMSIALATRNSDGAMSKEDKTRLASMPSAYVARKYDISGVPSGTLVDYRDKEIRIMCPTTAVFEKQNVGANGNANMYYMTFRAYAPDNAVSFKEGDKGVIIDEMFTFNGPASGIDEFGRKYSVCWLALALYDQTSDTWTYFGKNSSTSKYVGWDYVVEWFDADGVRIGGDQVRINLSNEDCHYNIEPYYMSKYATAEQLADLLYKAITISSFTISRVVTESGSTTTSPVELGSKITSVVLNWNTSKAPKTITLDGKTLDTSKTSHTYSDLSLTSNKTYNLKVTDERDSVAQKSAYITFCNRICYGAAEAPVTIDSDFVMSLATKNLAISKVNSGVKYNAGAGQYLWYCVPTRLGMCTFTDVETGLGAGFSLAATVSVTNASGYEENYYVYKSDYAGLGSLTVKVS